MQTDLVEYMIMGYNREDVRSCCDVCTAGWVVWCGVVSPKYSQYGTNEAAHDESPVSGDRTRSYGVVQDDFCLPELVAV